MNYEEYEKYHKNNTIYEDDENYKSHMNKTIKTQEQFNKLVNKKTYLEYIKGYEEEKYLEDVLLKKIGDKEIKDTYNLAKEICEYIDKCVYSVNEDKDILIDYINSKIIIAQNRASKNIFTNKENKRENKAKKGKLENYKRSKVVKHMIIPFLESNELFAKSGANKDDNMIQIQERNECSLRNYIRNNGELINSLTLAPHILAFFLLCEKRKYSRFGNELNRRIIKNNGDEYSLLDLFAFYNELYNFIVASEDIFKNNKIKLDDYIEYFGIGYDLFEDYFKGDRYLLILETLSKYKMLLNYKLVLYLGIVLMIDDIELSKKEIRRVIEYSYFEEDDEVEKIIYKILAYNKFVYTNIDKVIEIIIDKKMFKVVNNKNDIMGIKLFIDRYNLLDKTDSLIELADDIFYDMKLCDDFLTYEGVLDYINEEKAKGVNSKISAEKIFTSNSGILYLILGGFIQYVKE